MTITADIPVDQLRSRFRGAIITPQDDSYEAAASVWNGIRLGAIPPRRSHRSVDLDHPFALL